MTAPRGAADSASANRDKNRCPSAYSHSGSPTRMASSISSAQRRSRSRSPAAAGNIQAGNAQQPRSVISSLCNVHLRSESDRLNHALTRYVSQVAVDYFTIFSCGLFGTGGWYTSSSRLIIRRMTRSRSAHLCFSSARRRLSKRLCSRFISTPPPPESATAAAGDMSRSSLPHTQSALVFFFS